MGYFSAPQPSADKVIDRSRWNGTIRKFHEPPAPAPAPLPPFFIIRREMELARWIPYMEFNRYKSTLSLSPTFSPRYLPAGGNGPARNLSDDSSSHNKVESLMVRRTEGGKKNQKKSDGFE
jgi:hypothetical protein